MSIDYDKLRAELDEIEAGVHATTRYTWADLARKLLHIRDGLGELLEPIRQQVDDGCELVMWCPETMLNKLTDILEGDTQ